MRRRSLIGVKSRCRNVEKGPAMGYGGPRSLGAVPSVSARGVQPPPSHSGIRDASVVDSWGATRPRNVSRSAGENPGLEKYRGATGPFYSSHLGALCQCKSPRPTLRGVPFIPFALSTFTGAGARGTVGVAQLEAQERTWLVHGQCAVARGKPNCGSLIANCWPYGPHPALHPCGSIVTATEASPARRAGWLSARRDGGV